MKRGDVSQSGRLAVSQSVSQSVTQADPLRVRLPRLPRSGAATGAAREGWRECRVHGFSGAAPGADSDRRRARGKYLQELITTSCADTKTWILLFPCGSNISRSLCSLLTLSR